MLSLLAPRYCGSIGSGIGSKEIKLPTNLSPINSPLCVGSTGEIKQFVLSRRVLLGGNSSDGSLKAYGVGKDCTYDMTMNENFELARIAGVNVKCWAKMVSAGSNTSQYNDTLPNLIQFICPHNSVPQDSYFVTKLYPTKFMTLSINNQLAYRYTIESDIIWKSSSGGGFASVLGVNSKRPAAIAEGETSTTYTGYVLVVDDTTSSADIRIRAMAPFLSLTYWIGNL